MFKSFGKLVYDPKRSMEKNVTWWCVLEVNEDISGYFRWHLEKNWWFLDQTHKRKYDRPPHTPHCSIIRGEKPKKNIRDWKVFKNKEILDFEYKLDIRKTGMVKGEKDHFFFFNIYFSEYNEIRSHFGLPTERNGVPFKGHITFARCF